MLFLLFQAAEPIQIQVQAEGQPHKGLSVEYYLLPKYY